MGIFDTKNKKRLSKNTTIIAAKSKIKGNINIDGNLNIYGSMIGNISCSGVVVIGEGAMIQGNIKAHNLYICAKVTGDVYALMVEILPKGILKGNANTKNLLIDSNGKFDGKHLGKKI